MYGNYVKEHIFIWKCVILFSFVLSGNCLTLTNKRQFSVIENSPKVENCGSSGTFLDLRIQNCTNTDEECAIVTKREYNIQLDFEPSVGSSNLVWKVSANLSGNIVIITEEPIQGTVLPGVGYTLSYSILFDKSFEGLKFPVQFEIIDTTNGIRNEICVSSRADVSSWHMVPEILSRISPPIFPDRDFPLTDFGGVGDGVTLNTDAFISAIEACSSAGGGRVVVPTGVFLTSSITLLSNVNLHVTSGATILFTQDTSQYPMVFSRWEGMELINYSPFIYSFEQENIAITGTGVIDGNSDCEHWWPWKGKNSNLEKLCGIIEGFPTQDEDRNNLLDMVERGVPVEERVFGEGHYLRPQFVQPYRTKNILIEDVTFIKSPMWILNPVLCENIIVRGVTINSTGPNSDGCDPESCKDVLIENVHFRTGDDCIAVKSGRNNDGRRVNVTSENIVVQNCQMEDGHGGFTIGSEISGGARNIFAQNCAMESPFLEQALRFKNNAVRGALIEDIFIRNIRIRELYTGPSETRGMALSIDFYYEEGPAGNFTPIVRNVDIRNVTAAKSQYALYLRGFPEHHITDIRLYDCHFDEVVRPNVIEFVDQLGLFNVTLNGQIINGTSLEL